MKEMNEWFQWFRQPINLPVMAEIDKAQQQEQAFFAQRDIENFKRAEEDAELAAHAKMILEILEKRK